MKKNFANTLSYLISITYCFCHSVILIFLVERFYTNHVVFFGLSLRSVSLVRRIPALTTSDRQDLLPVRHPSLSPFSHTPLLASGFFCLSERDRQFSFARPTRNLHIQGSVLRTDKKIRCF